MDVLAEERRAELEAAWAECAELATAPNLLERFLHDLHVRGLAGEDHNAQLVYLAMVSRLLPRPLCIVVKGPSSGGKSEVVKRVLVYFPAAAFYIMTGMSERALAFMSEDLQHRILVIYEAAGMAGDIASAWLPSDRPVVERLATLIDTRERARRGVAQSVLVPGAQGQIVLNPLCAFQLKLDAEIHAIEDRLGLNPQSRLRLGIATGQAARSLQSLIEATENDDPEDPRIP